MVDMPVITTLSTAESEPTDRRMRVGGVGPEADRCSRRVRR